MSVTQDYKILTLTHAEFDAVREALVARDLELTAYIAHEPCDQLAGHLRTMLAAVQSAKANAAHAMPGHRKQQIGAPSAAQWRELLEVALQNLAQGGNEGVDHDERFVARFVGKNIGAELLDVADEFLQLIVVLNELRDSPSDAQRRSAELGLNLLYTHKYLQKIISVAGGEA